MAKSSTEMPQQMREAAQTSLDQAKRAVDQYLAAAKRAAETAEDTAQTLQASASELNRKAVGFAEANVGAAFDYAEKLVRASSPQEIASIQQEFLRTQIDQFTQQMRELGQDGSRTRS